MPNWRCSIRRRAELENTVERLRLNKPNLPQEQCERELESLLLEMSAHRSADSFEIADVQLRYEVTTKTRWHEAERATRLRCGR